MSLIGKLNKNYVAISNRLTSSYERKFGLPCDIYFPKFGANPNVNGNYDQTNIFATHQPASYSVTPNREKILFYIPNLLRKESMKTSETEFDNFYLEGEDTRRPFIETSFIKELPIQTKVVVYLLSTTMSFVVEKKQVVNGAEGHMLLRMYLIPLAEG